MGTSCKANETKPMSAAAWFKEQDQRERGRKKSERGDELATNVGEVPVLGLRQIRIRDRHVREELLHLALPGIPRVVGVSSSVGVPKRTKKKKRVRNENDALEAARERERESAHRSGSLASYRSKPTKKCELLPPNKTQLRGAEERH